jgi:hypothetical protein
VKKILLAIGLFFGLVSPGWNAGITFDSQSTGSICDSPGPTEPLTIVHTTVDAPDRLMTVLIAWRPGGGISGVTNKDIPMVEKREDDGGSGFCHSAIWYLVNPPVGTHDVVVTSVDGVCRAVIVLTYSGVDQNDPLPTSAGDNTDGSPVDVAITTVYDNSWILAAASTQNNRTLTELTDYTDQGDVPTTPDWTKAYGENRGPVSIASWTPGWTHSEGAIDNTISAVEIKEKVPPVNRCRMRLRRR